MVKNITNKRINGIIITKNRFHLSQLSFAFFNNLLIGIFSHNIILCINHLQSCFVKIKLYYTTLIVNRASCTIFHSLCHIINVDIIAEYLTSTSIFRRNRCTCKSDICSIRKCVADNSCCADNTLCNFFTIFIFSNLNLFSKSILTSVSLISHYYNIVAFRQRLVGLLKFLHCGKDNTVCLSASKQSFQVFSALCVHRLLS